jgi:hypothetical protein
MSAEPLVTQADSRNCRDAKPTNFKVMTALVGIHAVLSFAYFNPRSNVQMAAAIVVSVCMLYFFWRQKIWAKRLVLVTAALGLVLDVPMFSKLSTLGQVIIGARFALAVFLLYWLNTKLAKGYFQVAPSKNDAQQVT